MKTEKCAYGQILFIEESDFSDMGTYKYLEMVGIGAIPKHAVIDVKSIVREPDLIVYGEHIIFAITSIWNKLSASAKNAIMDHEYGHIACGHMEKIEPGKNVVASFEYEADSFSADKNGNQAMKSALLEAIPLLNRNPLYQRQGVDLSKDPIISARLKRLGRSESSKEIDATEVGMKIEELIEKLKKYILEAIEWIRVQYKKFVTSDLMRKYRQSSEGLGTLVKNMTALEKNFHTPKKLVDSVSKLSKDLSDQTAISDATEKLLDRLKQVRVGFCENEHGAITVSRTDRVFEEIISSKAQNGDVLAAVKDTLKGLDADSTDRDLQRQLSTYMRRLSRIHDGDLFGYIQKLERMTDGIEPMTEQQSDTVTLGFIAERILIVNKEIQFSEKGAAEETNSLDDCMKSCFTIIEKMRKSSNTALIKEVHHLLKAAMQLAIWIHKHTVKLLTACMNFQIDMDFFVGQYCKKMATLVNSTPEAIEKLVYS